MATHKVGKTVFRYATNFDNQQSRQRKGFAWPNWHSPHQSAEEVLTHLNWHHPDRVRPGGERPTQLEEYRPVKIFKFVVSNFINPGMVRQEPNRSTERGCSRLANGLHTLRRNIR